MTQIFFKFSYVHWTISFSSVVNCSVSLACLFAFRLLVFLTTLMLFSGRFIFMSKELDWWLKVDVTLSLCTNGSISPKGLSVEWAGCFPVCVNRREHVNWCAVWQWKWRFCHFGRFGQGVSRQAAHMPNLQEYYSENDFRMFSCSLRGPSFYRL